MCVHECQSWTAVFFFHFIQLCLTECPVSLWSSHFSIVIWSSLLLGRRAVGSLNDDKEDFNTTNVVSCTSAYLSDVSYRAQWSDHSSVCLMDGDCRPRMSSSTSLMWRKALMYIDFRYSQFSGSLLKVRTQSFQKTGARLKVVLGHESIHSGLLSQFNKSHLTGLGSSLLYPGGAVKVPSALLNQ